MRRPARGLVLAVLGLAAAALAARAQLSGPTPVERAVGREVPRERGLPVVVRVGVQFLEVTSVDDNAQAFEGTVDLRVRWIDPRLAYAASETPRGFHEYREDAVAARLGQMWAPDVTVANRVGEPTERRRSLRIFPDGRVEMMERTAGRFASAMDMERFPFDRQRLEIQVVAPNDGVEEVALEARRDDIEFSNGRPGLEVPGWTAGIVDVKADRAPGWYGDSHARLRARLLVEREPGSSAGTIFIPLFASLLIPLLALWLNRVEDGSFQIEAFELSNVIVGGLFAVIALNFTVNAEYSALGSSENTVTRLFALNYITLAVSLLANVVLFRFNLVKRLWGARVQEEVFLYLCWAVPLLAAATAAALLLAARA